MQTADDTNHQPPPPVRSRQRHDSILPNSAHYANHTFSPPLSQNAPQGGSAMSASDSEADLHGVFALMDTRGFGKILLEAIYEFCNAMPTPPDPDDVTRIYRQFDEDGSGDIDAQEFVGLCAALEDLLHMPASAMIIAFERAQYQKLFQLVDEDNGGTVDSHELKTVIEALHAMLSLKGTAADVAIMMRDMNVSELDFEEFYNVMKKLCKGKPILQVVKAFEAAQKRSKETKSHALMKFQSFANDVKSTTVLKKAMDKERVCVQCAKKELEIRELRTRLAELEAQLSQSFSSMDLSSVLNVEPRLAEASKSIETAVGMFKQFPAALPSAAHHAKSSRIRRIVESSLGTSQDQHSKRLSELADVTHRTQRQIGPAFDPVRDAALQICEMKLTALEAIKQKDPNVGIIMAETATKCSEKRLHAAAMAENLGWVAEVTAEVRSTLSEAALAAASFTSAPVKLMTVVRNAEEVTEEMWRLFVVLAFYASDNKSEVEELFDQGGAVAGMDVSVVESLIERATEEKELLKKAAFEALTGRLKDTTYAFQSVASSMQSSNRKDRGVGTAPLESILPVEPLRRLPPAKRHEDPSPKTAQQGPYSRPARARDIFAEPDRRAETVDALVSRYLASGVTPPTNFARVRPSDERMAHRHSFQFGTKVVELVIVDEYIAVIVGGGYMYFDEFCDRFTEQEENKLQRDLSTHRTVGNSAVFSAGSSSPHSSPNNQRKIISKFGVKSPGSPSGGPPSAGSPKMMLRIPTIPPPPAAGSNSGSATPNTGSYRRSASPTA